MVNIQLPFQQQVVQVRLLRKIRFLQILCLLSTVLAVWMMATISVRERLLIEFVRNVVIVIICKEKNAIRF